MNKQKLIKKMIDDMAEANDTIDLNAYVFELDLVYSAIKLRNS